MTASQYDVITFQGFVIQAFDFLGLILQVAVHHYDPVASGEVQSRGNSIVLTVITREFDGFYMRIIASEFKDDLPVIFRAAIINENDFITVDKPLESYAQAPVEFRNGVPAPIRGGHDRYLR